MAATLARGFTVRYRKPDGRANSDPVGIFAHDVAAVDDIDRENLIGPVTNAGLKSRLDHAWDIGCAGLAECLDRPLQDIGEFPVETEAIGQIMPVDGAVPVPAAIEVDPHGLGKPESRRHHRKCAEIFPGQRIGLASRIERKAEFADSGRDQVRLCLGNDIIVPQSPSLRNLLVSRLNSTGLRMSATQEGLATAEKSVLVAADTQLSTLHDPTSDMSAASTA